MKPTIYLYNLRNEKGTQIEILCSTLGVACHHVDPALYGEKIGYITQIEGFEKSKSDIATTPINDEMILFKEFDQEMLTNFLTSYRQAGITVVPLKAGLTPTNIHWSSVALHAELQQEHQAFLKNK